ncbi:hypothetical protein [Novosphingobium sp. KACC 22771]|uniref:hypothetical protein n=1 Tax=Novosphingobium sp. KACC 22771 TaxID=3025670 RepID=UPI002365BC53|nr:hypothetical protein [Novosphingobium sp. KACC 22771]WDF73669.1 hypothetical protein PQ467_06410 [Novosphingobium sp. KACC 22771]
MAREEAVRSLVHFDQPLDVLRRALHTCAWDWEGPPTVTLRVTNVLHVVQLYLKGELNSTDVEEWANLIEGRDDVGFEPKVKEAIFDLANPILQGSLRKVVPALLARL